MKPEPKQRKIGVLIPFTPLGGVIYTLFQYHMIGSRADFKGNIRFYPVSPKKFSTVEDLTAINEYFHKEFGQEPDMLVAFNMQFNAIALDNDFYNKLKYRKTFLALDNFNYRLDTDDRSMTIIDTMNELQFMPSLLKTITHVTNLLKKKADRIDDIYLTNQRRELLNLAVSWEKMRFTNEKLAIFNATFWTSGAEFHRNADEFVNLDKDCESPEIFMGFAFRLKEGFGAYLKSRMEKALEMTQATTFDFVRRTDRYVHTFTEEEKEKRVLFVRGVEGLNYDNAAIEFLKEDYNAVIILSHRSDCFYFYNNFIKPVADSYQAPFKPYTTSPLRGILPFSESQVERIKDKFVLVK